MKKHTRRTVRDPMAWITRRIPLASDQQIDLGNAYHMSLQAILRGAGNEQAWSTLACTLNIAMMLCEQGFHAGALDTIQRAQDALITCRHRAEKHGSWAFTGDEARTVMAACTHHDDQIATAPRANITAAIRMVHARIEEGEVLA